MKIAGSPHALLGEWLYEDKDLLAGSSEHIKELPTKIQDTLRSILKDYRDVFPAELPKQLPLDQGLGDVHSIPLILGAVPPSKRIYCLSPAE